MRLTVGVPAVLCGWAIVAACGGGGPAPGTVRPTTADSLYILVDNQSFLDATVYTAFAGAGRRRLGTVSGQSRTAYAVRWQGTEMGFVVDFVGSRIVRRSVRYVYRPGERVELQIPAAANQTGNLIVRRR